MKMIPVIAKGATNIMINSGLLANPMQISIMPTSTKRALDARQRTPVYSSAGWSDLRRRLTWTDGKLEPEPR